MKEELAVKIQQAMKQVRETASMLRYYECVDSVMDWDYWNHLPAEARTYAGRVSPVSYTHLDVYKRQMQWSKWQA